MESRKRADQALIVVFLLALVVVLPFDFACYREGDNLPGRSPFKPQDVNVSFKTVLAGTLGKSVEQEFMRRSTFVRGSVGRYNEFVYRISGRTPPSIRAGFSKWLFVPRRHEEITQRDFDRRIRVNTKFLIDMQRRLREKNAELIVAFVPDRSTMYPEKIYLDGKVPPRKKRFLPRLVKELNDRGLETYDLTAPILALKERGIAVSNSDDHHWNSQAAQVAGEFLAEQIAGRVRGRKTKQTAYRIKWEERPSKATLLNKLGFHPSSDLEESFHVSERFAVAKKRSKARGTPSAAYWSTSFGQYGSPEFFANKLRREVDILQKNGRGSSYAIEAGGLKRVPPPIADRRPFYVVWEIPEYHTMLHHGQPPEYISTAEYVFKKKKSK